MSGGGGRVDENPKSPKRAKKYEPVSAVSTTVIGYVFILTFYYVIRLIQVEPSNNFSGPMLTDMYQV